MSKKLQQELRRQHASKQEIADFDDIAEMLATVNPPGLSNAAKQRIASRLPVDVDTEQPKRRYVLQWTIAGLAGSFAVLFILMTSLAQSALPDPTVYNTKDDAEKTKKYDSSQTPRPADQQVQQLRSETKIEPDDSRKVDERKQPQSESRQDNERERRSIRDSHKRYEDKYRSSWSQDWWKRN